MNPAILLALAGGALAVAAGGTGEPEGEGMVLTPGMPKLPLALPPYLPSNPSGGACLVLRAKGSTYAKEMKNLRAGAQRYIQDGGVWVWPEDWAFHDFMIKSKPRGSSGVCIKSKLSNLAWRAYAENQPRYVRIANVTSCGREGGKKTGKANVAEVAWLKDLIGPGAGAKAALAFLKDLGQIAGKTISLRWGKAIVQTASIPSDMAKSISGRAEAAKRLVNGATSVWRAWIYNHPYNEHLRKFTDGGAATLELDRVFSCQPNCAEGRKVRVGTGGCRPVVFLPLPPRPE